MYSPRIVDGDEVRTVTNTGYDLVEGRDKIVQDVEMILSTNVRKSTGLGSNLESSLLGDIENPVSPYSQMPHAFNFQLGVRSALTRLKAAQRRHQFVYRTPKEVINDFSTATVWPVEDDPRNYRWEVNILTIDASANFSVGGIVPR